MKVDYAIIRIEVSADEEEINKRELALSDALAGIADELERWLQEKARGTHLKFGEVEIR